MSGLSVNEYDTLFRFIKNNVVGVRDEHVELCLDVLDGIKSGRIPEEREIEITGAASVDAQCGGDDDIDDVTILGVYAYPVDLIEHITKKCK